MTSRHALLLAPIVLCGCARPSSSTVLFTAEPARIDLEGRVLAKFKRQIEFTNRSPVAQTGLSVRASCACVVVLRPREEFSLRSGESRTVTFTYEASKPESARQEVALYRAQADVRLCAVPIDGKLVSVLADVPILPTIVVKRSFDGQEATAAEIALRVRRGYRIERLTSNVAWASARLRRDGERSWVTTSFKEGEHPAATVIPMSLDYTGPEGRWRESILLPYVERSVYRVTPKTIWLGRITTGARTRREIVVRGREAGDRVRETELPAGVRIVSRKRTADELRLTLEFDLTPDVRPEGEIVFKESSGQEMGVAFAGLRER